MWNSWKIFFTTMVIAVIVILVSAPILLHNMLSYYHDPDYAHSTVYAYGYPYTITDCYGVSESRLGNTKLPVAVLMHLTTPTSDGYANVEFSGLCSDRKYIVFEYDIWGAMLYTVKMVE